MNHNIPVSPFLDYFTKPQKTLHLPIVSAKMESLVIQFNALVKVMRTKKFRELREYNYPAWSERLEIYTDEQEKLVVQIEALGDAHGGTVHIWDGAV
jgi:hypothetical protein